MNIVKLSDLGTFTATKTISEVSDIFSLSFKNEAKARYHERDNQLKLCSLEVKTWSSKDQRLHLLISSLTSRGVLSHKKGKNLPN